MKFTNNNNLPDEIVTAIVADDYDHPINPREIPTHTLINPIKQSILINRHQDDIIEDVSDNVWRMFGQSIHYIIEKQNPDGALYRIRLKSPIGGYIVTGRPDCYNPKSKELIDYKVTSVWTLIYGGEKGRKEWEEQLNIYSWLLNNHNHNVDKLKIIAILRDWQQIEAYKSADYPQSPIVSINIKLWSHEEQERYISVRLSEFDRYNQCDDDTIPVCLPKERWGKPTKWAVIKEGNKKATKICASVKEAREYIKNNTSKMIYTCEKREGRDVRCERYCSVNTWCNHYKEGNK